MNDLKINSMQFSGTNIKKTEKHHLEMNEMKKREK